MDFFILQNRNRFTILGNKFKFTKGVRWGWNKSQVQD